MQRAKRQRELKYISVQQIYHFSPQNTPQCPLKLV